MKHLPFLRTALAVACAGILAAASEPTWAVRSGTQDQPRKTELHEPVVEIPIDVSDGRPVLRVAINGKPPVRLALDTTMRGLVLAEDMADVLGLKPTRMTGSAVRSTDPHGNLMRPPLVAPIESLTMAKATLSGLDAVFLPRVGGTGAPIRYAGRLGLSLFADVLLTIDYPSKKLILQRGSLAKSDERGTLEYKPSEGRALVTLVFDGIPVDVMVATPEAGGFVLPKPLRKQVRLAWDHDGRHTGIRTFHAPRHPPLLGTVKLGIFDLAKPPARFREQPPSMGHEILHHFRITIDQRSKRIRFARSEETAITFPPSAAKYGLVFLRGGAGIRIHEIIPGSPAARSPLQKGDFIVMVDGQGAAALDDTALLEHLFKADDVVIKLFRRGAEMLVPLSAGP